MWLESNHRKISQKPKILAESSLKYGETNQVYAREKRSKVKGALLLLLSLCKHEQNIFPDGTKKFQI